jgi:hypothetical protein
MVSNPSGMVWNREDLDILMNQNRPIELWKNIWRYRNGSVEHPVDR